MAKKRSKKSKKNKLVFRIRRYFSERKEKRIVQRKKHVKLHKSFKRSYKEDYKRELEVPGIMYHIFATFRVIFRNYKLFLPLLAFSVFLAIVFVGLMDENSYQHFREILNQTAEENGFGDMGNFAKSGLLLISTITTGGLSGDSSESAMVFIVIIFLIIWLVTIFLLRHRLANRNLSFRDALYNSTTPLISTFAVFIVAMFQCIPIFFLVVVYSSAVQTEFLSMPFYALVFFIFAGLMILISSYLLSSSLMALVAVSAPGMYPMNALRAASDLMAGRRVKFILRVAALIIAIAIIWVIVMIPLIFFDLLMKNFEWTKQIPFVPFCLLTMTCFTGIYVTAYLYLYYRWMLNYEEK